MRFSCLTVLVLLQPAGNSLAVAADALTRQFENEVRPLLATHCWKCHGAAKQEAGLRLDSAEALARGGKSGVPIVPGRSAASLLLGAVRHTGKLKMPPGGKLKSNEIAALERWIRAGAVWPKSASARAGARRSEKAHPVAPVEPDHPSLAGALELWLRADLLPLRTGEAVFVWPDQSGKGHDLSVTRGVRKGGVGKPPAFIETSEINGRPALQFEPDSGIAGSPDHLPNIHGDAGFTIFLVASFKPSTAQMPYDSVLFIGDPAKPNNPGKPCAALIEIERTNPKQHQLDLAGGWGHDASLGPGSAHRLYMQPHILAVIRKRGPWADGTRFWLDGESSAKTWQVNPKGTNAVPDIQHRLDVGVSMGKALSWCGGFRGQVAEVIVFNRVLTDKEREGIEASLASRYGLRLPEVLAAAARTFTTEEKGFWAFQPVRKPSLPIVKNISWPISPIDRFILSRLEQHGLEPSRPADRRTLIRRVTFDLTGLPPTPQEIECFLKDPGPDQQAYAKMVDRLLASPHYGERWGRHWLDIVRYADTTANDGNFLMRYAWRYRDHVVKAFQADKPYDQFIIEQLAGDLIPAAPNPEVTTERIIATGFLMVGPKALAETDFEQVKMDIVDEQIDVTGRAFLGLTIACARCHDHKYDAIPTVDYYSLAGIFRSTETLGDMVPRATMWMEYPTKVGGKQITVMAVKDGKPIDLRIHRRGNRFTLGELAPRRFLQVLAGEGHRPLSGPSSGRLELARWIASPINPLTARVMVNRIWQYHFGVGLVPTSDNFGVQGEKPSHPELLDWLASYFVEAGWSVKAMHRVMLLSRAYQTSSTASLESETLDPRNRLLSHMQRRRIDAEELRDALLAVSGQLDRKVGGGELISEVLKKADIIDKKRQLASASTLNSSWEGFNTHRRSIYLPVIRNGQADILALFDAADANAVTARRNESTVPAQTAFLLNNPFVRKLAWHFARDVPGRAVAGDGERIRVAYVRSLGRPPTDVEMSEAKSYLDHYCARLQAAGRPANFARESAWESFCHLLFCLNEFLYLE